MSSHSARICPLPIEVQGQIKSSINITNLQDVVVELLKNALDAGSESIDFQIDFLKGYCAITDNGVGIPAQEFEEEGCLGKMHCTSKDQVSTKTYGQYGRFLASLSALCLLSVQSHHKQTETESTVTFHRSRVISRSTALPEEDKILNSHGTKVVVRNLFGDMPVRLKHRTAQFENMGECARAFDSLRKSFVSLLLAWLSPVNISVYELHSKQSYSSRGISNHNSSLSLPDHWPFDRNHVCGILARAGFICRQDRESWKIASARTASVSIRAAISLTPVPARNRQFMSIGILPLDPTLNSGIFYDEVNRLFELSAFGSFEDEAGGFTEQRDRPKERHVHRERHTLRELRGAGKGVDRWPMFYIRIGAESASTIANLPEGRPGNPESSGLLHLILELLRSLVQQFLIAHNFQAKPRNPRIRPMAFSWSKSAPMPHAQDLPIHETRDHAKRPISSASTPGFPVAATFNTGLRELPFGGWARVKAAHSAMTADLLSGLPRSKRQMEYASRSPYPHMASLCDDVKIEVVRSMVEESPGESAMASDVQLLLENLSDCCSEEEPQQKQPVFAETNEDGTAAISLEGSAASLTTSSGSLGDILWTSAQTGTRICLDSRTGLILPEPQVAALVVEDEPLQFSRTKDGTETRGPALAKTNTREALEARICRLLHTSEASIFRSVQEPIRSTSCLAGETTEDSSIHNRQQVMRCQKGVALSVADPRLVLEHRLSKSGLEKAAVLGQVDKKFILVRVPAAPDSHRPIQDLPEELLVLIDQHAADERVKVEQLYEELCNAESVSLKKPIIFEVPNDEAAIFMQRREDFARWKVVYTIKETEFQTRSRLESGYRSLNEEKLSVTIHCVAVMALPSLIAERCRLEPKIIIHLLRKEIWSDRSTNHNLTGIEPSRLDRSAEPWTSRISGCPEGLLDMLRSRACRSAIMFNDILSGEQCETLVLKLASCTLPFQCAHSRPSMIVVTDLGLGAGTIANGEGRHDGDRQRSGGFANAWRHWRIPK